MLFDLSTSLVAHGSLTDTLRGVVRTVRSLFDLAGCAIVLPAGDGIRLAASTARCRATSTSASPACGRLDLDPAPGPVGATWSREEP